MSGPADPSQAYEGWPVSCWPSPPHDLFARITCVAASVHTAEDNPGARRRDRRVPPLIIECCRVLITPPPLDYIANRREPVARWAGHCAGVAELSVVSSPNNYLHYMYPLKFLSVSVDVANSDSKAAAGRVFRVPCAHIVDRRNSPAFQEKSIACCTRSTGGGIRPSALPNQRSLCGVSNDAPA
ncbi:hypothetical protein B0H17DRAFT_1133065 [Mycena rosella]|uniref:Uncharacterized protein n=1 Tax=Mycena rosella TaxID=1033263 RepID=A0AAD7GFL3_MYCRO|nr:hypothetical protein B0H17DRAFT_1133065 [Mycena rosella]